MTIRDNNTVYVNFGNGVDATADAIWQYDTGLYLKVVNVPNMPSTFQAQFSNQLEGGTAKAVVGSDSVAQIPDEFTQSGEPIYVWLVFNIDGMTVRTERVIKIPVKKRPKVVDE